MCHSDITPYTLKARSERIGTQDFVNNCVYVAVKQHMTEKKNIVKTLPTGGATVVNHVPSTQDTGMLLRRFRTLISARKHLDRSS